MNKNSILTRLVLGAIFSAIAIGLLASQILYKVSVAHQNELSHQAIEQLNKTVSSTAAVAVYINDQELAKEVINGLTTNDVVKYASINSLELNVSSTGYEHYKQQTEFQIDNDSTLFSIYSPFDADRRLGVLEIVANREHVEHLAHSIANNNLLLTALLMAVTIVTVTIMLHLIITRPLMIIQKSLNSINPGDNSRLTPPRFHRHSELGILVSDTNQLLDKAEFQINQERDLRGEIEAMSERMQIVFERSVTAMALTDEKGTILLANQAFDTLLKKIGVNKKNNYGVFFNELFDKDKKTEEAIRTALINRETVAGEFKLKNHDVTSGEEVWGSVVFSINTTNDYRDYYQFNFVDISHSKQRIKELDKLANYDQLTGIMNRQSAEWEIQKLIDHRSPFSLILLDLNEFKPINDVYGHDSGDKVLIHVAKSMKSALRKNDICARWGGDEFVIVCHQNDKKGLIKVANNLVEKIKAPYFLAQHNISVSVGASLGCVIYQEDNCDLLSLVKLADEAMYAVKSEKNSDTPPKIRFADEI